MEENFEETILCDEFERQMHLDNESSPYNSLDPSGSSGWTCSSCSARSSSTSSSSEDSWFSVDGVELSFEDAMILNPKKIQNFAWNEEKDLYFLMSVQEGELDGRRRSGDSVVDEVWVYCDVASKLWPQIVIDFYLEHLVFGHGNDDEGNNNNTLRDPEEEAELDRLLEIGHECCRRDLEPVELVDLIRCKTRGDQIFALVNFREVDTTVVWPLELFRSKHPRKVLDFLQNCLDLIDEDDEDDDEEENVFGEEEEEEEPMIN